jgi:hypothetical protein
MAKTSDYADNYTNIPQHSKGYKSIINRKKKEQDWDLFKMNHPEANVNPNFKSYQDRNIALKHLSKSKKRLCQDLDTYA